MKRIFFFCLASFFLSSSLIAQKNIELFVFTKTDGYRHKSIDDGVKALWKMSLENNWTVTFSEDSSHFNSANLSRYNAIIFLNTTLNVLGEAQERAFEKYINNGGAFVGIHAATDTEYDWEWYGQMIGARFKSHPATQSATLNVHHNCSHPSVDHLQNKWEKVDEWYNFKEPVPSYVNVLLDLDESTYEGKRMGINHPIAWYHTFEGGRIFYTGLGHTPKTYTDSLFLQHLKEGIRWATGLTHVPTPKEWTNLLDQKLTHWDKFMGVPHVSVKGIEGFEKSENVHVGKSMGLNQDVKNVFTMKEENGEQVLHVSGEIYGGLTSKQEYQDYHLKLEYKWGEKKWEPRLQQKKDSGLLYHCTGKHGAFWNVWMRCLELQIQEGDTGDFIALAGANGMTRTQKTADNLNYKFTLDGEWCGVGDHYKNWACAKSTTHENPANEWNTVELYSIGDDAIHVVNGQVVNVVKDAHIFKDGLKIPMLRGKLQLQSEAAEIFYKNVKIRAIEEFPLNVKNAAGL